MEQDYKSVEQRIWDATKSTRDAFGNFSSGFIKSFYGMVATPFRIPTLIRKFSENQTLVQKYPTPEEFSNSEFNGVMSGVVLGAMTDVGIPLAIASNCHSKEDYTNLALAGAALLVTNVGSGIFEATRTAFRKKHNLEAKTEKQ